MIQSQTRDPFIRNMFFNFKVAADSPAIQKLNLKTISKSDMRGIKHFKMAGARNELEMNSLVFANKKYINIPQQLRRITEDSLGDH